MILCISIEVILYVNVFRIYFDSINEIDFHKFFIWSLSYVLGLAHWKYEKFYIHMVKLKNSLARSTQFWGFDVLYWEKDWKCWLTRSRPIILGFDTLRQEKILKLLAHSLALCDFGGLTLPLMPNRSYMNDRILGPISPYPFIKIKMWIYHRYL